MEKGIFRCPFFMPFSNFHYIENPISHRNFAFLNHLKIMQNSNFWYYVIMAVVILHFVIGFGYLIYKLSPRKSDKEKKNTSEEEN